MQLSLKNPFSRGQLTQCNKICTIYWLSKTFKKNYKYKYNFQQIISDVKVFMLVCMLVNSLVYIAEAEANEEKKLWLRAWNTKLSLSEDY